MVSKAVAGSACPTASRRRSRRRRPPPARARCRDAGAPPPPLRPGTVHSRWSRGWSRRPSPGPPAPPLLAGGPGGGARHQLVHVVETLEPLRPLFGQVLFIAGGREDGLEGRRRVRLPHRFSQAVQAAAPATSSCTLSRRWSPSAPSSARYCS